jgi:hypothetical protein
VEVRLFHSEKRRAFHVMLVNLTTNPLVWLERWGAAVVRYVTPHKGLRIALRLDVEVTAARSLIGGEVRHRQENGMLTLEVPLLDLYESIVVEYA